MIAGPAKTIVRRNAASQQQCGGLLQLHPVLQRIYANRGISDREEVSHELSGLIPCSELPGTEQAARLLHRIMQRQGRILIVADFDADGATSCALAVSALEAMGASCVDYIVPNRFEYGYGLTPEIVELALTRSPDLILTVDNGISSISGVQAANSAGVPVLVTDHHLPSEELPEAEVIVNPNCQGNPFPSKHLAGVGVMFYVLVALRALLRDLNWFNEQGIEEPNLATFLDLVALGTVADVVPLDRNNRILVSQGMKRIQAGRCRPGILALLDLAKRNYGQITASDLGYSVAPRLNAAGRLEDMSTGIECLLASDFGTAVGYARSLDKLNRERRQIEQQMKEQAFSDLEEIELGERLPYGICMYGADWHQGVIGILAARVKERLNRPAIIFARAEDGMLKGSGRSVQGLHIKDTLDAIASRYPNLIARFGGHAMAAGLTLAESGYETFCAAFDEEVRTRANECLFQNRIESDGSLPAGEMGLELAQLLRESGPWGQGFPEPLFDGIFRVVAFRVVGGSHLKLTLQPEGSDHSIDAIAFNQADSVPEPGCNQIHAAYRLGVNEYNNRRSAQLIIEFFQPANSF